MDADTRTLDLLGVEARCGRRPTCTLPAAGQHSPAALQVRSFGQVLTGQLGAGMGRIDVTVTLGVGTDTDEQVPDFSLLTD